MAVLLRQFREQIASIGLIPEAELEGYCQKLDDVDETKRVEKLARALVREKKLTAFQAQQLYAGKGSSLVLGNYLVLDKLGQGGMGMVLKAMHRRMDRVVAIKILSPAVTKTPEALQRFQREVKAAARLEHPHIVPAYDADESNGTHFLVMQYVEGTDLSSLVRDKGPLRVEEALTCILQAARGLEFAHSRGIVHRDIKPANILLDKDGTVRILDMGLARIDAEDVQLTAQLTGTGQIMGTVDYMAPEQAVDTKTVDARADIYSLGVTLWYLLTARALYTGDSIVKKLMAHQTAAIPSLQDSCPRVSPQLEQVFNQMVAKSPDARYQTMTEVTADLERCLSTDPSSSFVASPRSESSRLSSLFHRTAEASPTIGGTAATEDLGHPVATAANTEIAPTIALNSSEVGTDPRTAVSLIRVEPQARATTAKRKPGLPRWSKYVAAGLLPLLLLAGVIVVITNKDGSKTRIELPEGATAEIINEKPVPANVPQAGTRPAREPANTWIELFNGKDLTGWRKAGEQPWKVTDGVLTCADGSKGMLLTEGKHSDFELTLQFRMPARGNSGIYLRADDSGDFFNGIELQLCDDTTAPEFDQTPLRLCGALYDVAPRAIQRPVETGTWHDLSVEVRGNAIQVRIDGELWCDAPNDVVTRALAAKGKVLAKPGRIGIQAHGTPLEFRAIRLRDLSASNLTPSAAISTLPPFAGIASLVPRPQFISGLKSWDIVRAMPAGVCARIEPLPDGRFVTAWYHRPGVHIHGPDLRVQQVLLSECKENAGVFGMAVARQRGLVAAYDRPSQIRVWEIDNGRTVYEPPSVGFASSYALEFSHSARHLAAMANALYVIDISGEQKMRSVRVHDDASTRPRSLVWSPDDSQLWLATADKLFAAFNATDLKPISDHPLQGLEVTFLRPSPDNSLLLTALTTGEVRIYNVADWSITHSWQLEPVGDVSSCDWSPDQSEVAVSVSGRVESWDLGSQTARTLMKERAGQLAWATDGKSLLSLGNINDSFTISPSTGMFEPIRWGTAGIAYHKSITLSPDGRTVCSAGEKYLAFFDAETGVQQWRRRYSGSAGIGRFTQAGDRVATWDYANMTDVLGTSDGKRVLRITGVQPEWSPDDAKLLVRTVGGRFVIHHSATGDQWQEFEVPEGELYSAAWSPDGTRVAVRVARGTNNSDLHIWDTRSQSLVSRTTFPDTATRDVHVLWPIWKSNEKLLVPFGAEVFEVSAINLNDSTIWPTKARNVVYGLAYDVKSDRALLCDTGVFWVVDGQGRQIASKHGFSSAPLHSVSDGRRFCTSAYSYYDLPSRGIDTSDSLQDLGCCFPYIGSEGWLTIGPTGHYQGSEGIESEFLYVAEHLDGHQQTYTAAEFAKAFSWKNDPKQATFLKLVETVYIRRNSR